MSQRFIPADDSAADHIVENTGIHTGLVGIQLQNAAHIPQPRPDIVIPEAEGHRLSGLNVQILQKSDAGKGVQRSFIGSVACAMVTFHGIFAFNRQWRCLSVFTGRDLLNIGDDVRPVTAEPKKTVKKRVKIR